MKNYKNNVSFVLNFDNYDHFNRSDDVNLFTFINVLFESKNGESELFLLFIRIRMNCKCHSHKRWEPC